MTKSITHSATLEGETLAAPPVPVGAERGPALWAFIVEVGV